MIYRELVKVSCAIFLLGFTIEPANSFAKGIHTRPGSKTGVPDYAPFTTEELVPLLRQTLQRLRSSRGN